MNDRVILYHIVSRERWEREAASGVYRGDTLDSEGFIHCSLREQVLRVANERFRGQSELVLLVIDSTRSTPELRFENTEGGAELFPHIYGALDLESVTAVLPFDPDDAGRFQRFPVEPSASQHA